MRTCTLAVIQDNFQQPKHRNLEMMKRYLENCMVQNPETKLIVFPEGALSGYSLSKEHIKESAENADGPSFHFLAKIAKEHNIYIVYGFFERKSNEGKEQYFNSVNIIGSDGSLAEVYQKIHLTPLENHLFSAGNRLVTLETEFGKLGFLICWDMAFPELSRLLAKEDVDIIIAASAWERPYDGSYMRMASARAMDNTAFLATCNHTGGEERLQFFGQSAIYGPDGETISEARTEEPRIISAEIDLKRINQLREAFYSMKNDERNDLYSIRWEGE